MAAKASQRDKLEHLARDVSRSPVAAERLSLTEGGLVRLALKTPYRDGTTHVIFEPEDFKDCRSENTYPGTQYHPAMISSRSGN